MRQVTSICGARIDRVGLRSQLRRPPPYYCSFRIRAPKPQFPPSIFRHDFTQDEALNMVLKLDEVLGGGCQKEPHFPSLFHADIPGMVLFLLDRHIMTCADLYKLLLQLVPCI